jgi:chromosome segregation ATPase
MSAMQPSYNTGVTDSGDETDATITVPPLPGAWVGRFDAAYWQTQAETAIRALEQAQDTLARVEAERDAALRECADTQEDSWAWLAELQALRGATEPELDTIRGKLTRVLGERDAALAQCAAVTRQLVEAEAHNTDLITDASRFLGERDAALAQLASVKRQLAQTGETLHAERRAAVAQQRRSHLD